MTPEALRKTFNINADIVIEPKSNRPVCITYDIIDGNEDVQLKEREAVGI